MAEVVFPAGIPDFRSPGTGLYDNLQKYDLEDVGVVSSLDNDARIHAMVDPFSRRMCSMCRFSKKIRSRFVVWRRSSTLGRSMYDALQTRMPCSAPNFNCIDTTQPTNAHYFIRLLHEKGVLLRNFTQNIDTLERIAGVYNIGRLKRTKRLSRLLGIPPEKLVEAHGSFATAHCITCRAEYPQSFVKDRIMADDIPTCFHVRY